MHDFIINLFSTGSFIPHGHCYLWKPELVWLHLISDAIIALAYYSIPLTLFYFVRKRQDLPFNWIFLLFAAFIVFCGTTHIAEIWTLWHPTYWLSGMLKAGTAIVSLFTAIELVPLVPQALALPSPTQLTQANKALHAQIEERLQVENQLRRLQNELEQRVQVRTAELMKVNQQLQQEIDERHRTEAALRASRERLILAQQVGKIGTCEWNLQTGELIWTEEMETLFGLAPGSFEGSYEHWLKRLHPDDRLGADIAAQKTITQGADFDTELRIMLPDGRIRWVAARAKIFYDETGKPDCLIGVNMDITDRKHAEAEREKLLRREQTAREQAEAANRIKDEFLAVLSHELRSPLNPILGWAKLLQTGTLNKQKTKHALATIERNANLQTQLIGDLLDVSRILQGKLNLNIALVDLATTIRSAMETVDLAAQAKSIQLQVVLNKSVGKVAGDSARLGQIIWNLLSNAVKFTPEGGRVEIRLQELEYYAQITVSDTGKGISPDFLPYVFDHFRQEDGATTRKFGGLGLGLAIVRHLTELHGGTVTAESAGIGQGATFTVRIPLMKAAGLENQANLDSSTNELATTSPLFGFSILVVDDDVDTRDYISFVLEEAGATVILAASADEALQLLIQSIPDILLSDIGMPDMDGYTLIRQVRSLPSKQLQKIKAIALTAYAGDFNQQQALSAGFQRHISKPVEPDVLVRVITSLLNQT
ncbi:multi-sensor hybrid histidine kinase [Nostoc sp. NIES-4103]|nr:multi-sensor hybrid histidine kinase [Nostoc sp. NIES-4103]